MCDWDLIVREHGPLAWQAAYRLLGNGADADDCLQDALVAAFDMQRKRSITNWGGLLRHLATARALDRLRWWKQHAHSTLVLTDVPHTESSRDDPLQQAGDAELMDRLLDSLAQLPPRQAEIFCLRHLDSLTYREIADAVGISVDAVGVQLHRTAAALRKLLDRPVGRLRR